MVTFCVNNIWEKEVTGVQTNNSIFIFPILTVLEKWIHVLIT